MQKVEYKELPSPHVRIENFLSIPASKECLAEAQALEYAFEPAKTIGNEDDSDGCEECEATKAIAYKGIRQNDVVYMDSHYKNRRHESKILGHLKSALSGEAFSKAFSELPFLFPIVNQTTHMETILSSYGPQQFEGGELILSGKTIADQLPYAPVHNSAIFFQSNQCVHAVDATVHEGDFKDSRFSINLWLGFDPNPENGISGRYR